MWLLIPAAIIDVSMFKSPLPPLLSFPTLAALVSSAAYLVRYTSQPPNGRLYNLSLSSSSQGVKGVMFTPEPLRPIGGDRGDYSRAKPWVMRGWQGGIRLETRV